jgi:hypothetical protein
MYLVLVIFPLIVDLEFPKKNSIQNKYTIKIRLILERYDHFFNYGLVSG